MPERSFTVEDQTLKITGVLSDPTRYSIYQYLLTKKEGVTVLEIADKFEIHPNVARLHLSKLEDVELVHSKAEKTGKGGRPGRLYIPSDKVVSISFPPRDFQTLSDVALQSLASLGKEGEEAFTKTGRKTGYEQAMEYIERTGINPSKMSLDELVPHILKLTGGQGLHPEIEKIDEYTLRFRVSTCTFKESTDKFSSVCKMHHMMLTGIFEAFFGRVDLIEEDKMAYGAPTCEYIMVQLP